MIKLTVDIIVVLILPKKIIVKPKSHILKNGTYVLTPPQQKFNSKCGPSKQNCLAIIKINGLIENLR